MYRHRGEARQELHKQRQVIRDEIGALEEELAKCEDEDEAASEK